MIKHLPKHLTFNTVLVPVSFVGLLPPEVYKHIFGIVMLDPIVAMAHNLANKRAIVTQSDIELFYPSCTLCLSSPKIFDVYAFGLDSIMSRDFNSRGTTLKFRRSGRLVGLLRRKSYERMYTYIKLDCTLRILY
jgi:hypothetical protein